MTALGVLAGAGLMPVLGVEGARTRGRDVFVVDAGPEANGLLPEDVEQKRIPIWQYGAVVDAFLRRGVKDVYLLGKWPARLLEDALWDDAARAVLAGVAHKGEHEVIRAFVEDMTRRGLGIRSQVELLKPLLVPADFAVGADALTPQQRRDIRFGYDVACALADKVAAGQTAIVKDGLVLALEAAEGTDAAIRRGGALGGPGAIVVKVKGRRRDDFDLPVVGLETVQAAADVQAAALVMEAGQVFLLQREQVVKTAQAAGVALVAFGRGGGGCRAS